MCEETPTEATPMPTDIETALQTSPGISDQNRRYFEENVEEIRAEYAGHHVAIVDGELAGSVAADASSPEFDEFLDRLREEYGEEAVAAAFIEYVASGDEELML